MYNAAEWQYMNLDAQTDAMVHYLRAAYAQREEKNGDYNLDVALRVVNKHIDQLEYYMRRMNSSEY